MPGHRASSSIRWWLCTASVLPRPCCSAWAGEYLGSDASERQIALPSGGSQRPSTCVHLPRLPEETAHRELICPT
jgi:hypothetical protein